MTADTFREILHRKPFEPFQVAMSSGESYNVLHPEMALVSARSLILALPDPPNRTANGWHSARISAWPMSKFFVPMR